MSADADSDLWNIVYGHIIIFHFKTNIFSYQIVVFFFSLNVSNIS